MTTIEQLSNQFIPIIVVIAFAWYISQFAKATIPRLIFVSFGAYFAILGATEFDKLIGIGFVLPHLKFFFEWILDIFESFKRGTIDTYYTLLTIYYKTRNLFIRIYRFFRGFKTKSKKEQQDYYQKQDYREYEDFGQSSQNENRKEQRQEYREESYEEQDSYSNYEEPKQSYQEETHDDIPSEYKQFFSSSYYEVLGVGVDEEFSSIKKKFRKLQRQYHPDLNIDETELFTKISQNLNQAYEYFEKIHKSQQGD